MRGVAGVVRVSVVAGEGAARDLAIPAQLDVATALAGIAAALRLPASGAAVSLVQADGRSLDLDRTLAAQGVRDGAVLAVVEDEDVPAAHDDPAAAVADEVRGSVLGWSSRLTRPAALVAVALLLVVAAAALASGPAWSGAVAAGATVLLGSLATVAARLHDRLAAAVVGWSAVAFGAVAGWQVGGAALAGGSAVVVGLVVARAQRGTGAALVPACVAAALLGGLALLAEPGPFDPALVAGVALAGSVVLVHTLPRLALAVTGGRADVAREVLRASLVALGVVEVVLAVLAAAGGAAGAALACAVGLITVCRATRHHGAAEVVIQCTTGVLLLLVAGVMGVVGSPAAAGPVGGVALALALVAVLVALAPPSTVSTPQVVVWVDRAESLLLVTLVPLLAVSVGAVELTRDLVGR